MGGSGGGVTPRPPRTGPPGGPDACDRLRFETNLMSPQAAALALVRVGDLLAVGLQHEQDRRFVVALNASGQTVGTIGSERAIALIECMDKAFVYVAEVLSIEGGACRVLVQRERR